MDTPATPPTGLQRQDLNGLYKIELVAPCRRGVLLDFACLGPVRKSPFGKNGYAFCSCFDATISPQ